MTRALPIGLVVSLTALGLSAQEPLVVRSVLDTTPLFNYEGAPATPDADDPAIWVNRRHPSGSLVIGTAKDAGLLVYDLSGRLVQALLPPNAPQVSQEDPPTPAGPNGEDDNPCLDSAGQETFVFDTSFNLTTERGRRYQWTPCREAEQEEPQSEGLVFDAANDTLYVAFETIGLYKLSIKANTPAMVRVGVDKLIEPVTSFGRAYRAIPDDDEFECVYDPQDEGAAEDIEAEGSDANAGRFLQADLEGLSIILSVPGQTLLLASSQGDSSFHFFRIQSDLPRHLGSFLVDGVGDTDGVHFVPVPLTSRYPLGLLVVQNGQAPEPPDTSDVNGYEFDGATQFKFVNFLETLKALRN